MRLQHPLICFLLAWAALFPGFAQVKPPEKPASTTQEYSQEAYVIERLYTRFT